MASTENNKIKVFGLYGSAPTRTLLTLLELTKVIPYEFVVTDLTVAKTDEYKKKNPNGRLPCIQDLDGEFYWESHAILRYLCDNYKAADHWYPRDPKKRLKVDMFLDWRHTQFYVYIALNFVYPHLFDHHKLDTEESTKHKIEYGKRMMENELQKLNDIFLGHGNKYLTGDELTIADISVACVYVMLRLVGYSTEKYTTAEAWLKRISALPEWTAVHAKGFDGWVAYNASQGLAYKK